MALKVSKFDWIGYIKNVVVSLLKNKIMKVSLAKLATYTIVGPIKAWLLTFVIEELFEHLVEPLLKEMGYSIEYKIDQVSGKKKLDKIEKAKSENDIDTYVNTIADI